MTTGDTALWESLVSMEQSAAKLRAAVNNSSTRIEMLTAALRVEASVWDQGAALNFLRLFTRDVSQFVPQIFGFAVSGRWEREAREVLAAGPRGEVLPEVIRRAAEYLPRPDVEDYLQLASILASLESAEALAGVASDAMASSDPEIQEAGTFIRQQYANIIGMGFYE
ncbi:hypothetical protein [Kitasatospora sp. NBC_01539]|uniref:hypothetical protein n=1 Tax=Kitasatospora sp. NBC_01539 TaxID=2903577 RepID=UPI0038603181